MKALKNEEINKVKGTQKQKKPMKPRDRTKGKQHQTETTRHWKKVKISKETSLWFLYGFQKFHSLFKNQMWLFCGFLRLSFKGCKYPYKIHIRLINLHVMYGN